MEMVYFSVSADNNIATRLIIVAKGIYLLFVNKLLEVLIINFGIFD